ncbi:hypothetical protein [Streptomyces megasporus]|uniref:hypothetical protein n=1 Tax=Streptomyces megasporus TaxID=44060 RepID=UPI00055B65C7|nr:hypothetical protein [Streptomyces megasporus]
MTTDPTTGTASGWDQAVFRCGRCGAELTATTEDNYRRVVGVHTDAHALWDRLNPIEREGLASILRVILAAPDLGTEFLALMDRANQADTRGTPHTQETHR